MFQEFHPHQLAETMDRTRESRIVIIGAGIGGLTAGALLAHRGLEVEIFEQSPQLGGCCQSFVRDGHRFDAAACFFMGLGENGYNAQWQLYQELGLNIPVTFLDPGYVIWSPSSHFTIDHEFSRFRTQLINKFPGSEKEIDYFYRTLHMVRRAVDAIPFYRPHKIKECVHWFLKNMWIIPILAKYDRISVRDLAEKVFRSRSQLQFFDTMIKIMCETGMQDCPVVLASVFLTEPHRGGFYYPKGGAATLVHSLREVILENGGKIHVRQPVRNIELLNGKIQGVRLEDNSYIEANCVISNASAWTTYSQLVNRSALSEKFVRRIQDLKPTSSVFLLYLSLNKEFVEQRFHMHTLFPKDEHGPAMFMSIPSLVDSSAAPLGKHAATLMVQAHYSDWENCPNYEKKKRDSLKKVLDTLEKRIPGIKDSLKCLTCATPRTIFRWTRRNFGSIGGPQSTVGQFHARNLSNKSPLKNLYLVGDSTFPGSGVVGATVSGILCANIIHRGRTGN